MQNLLLEKFEINGEYAAKRVKVGELDKVLNSFKLEGVAGINVTTPHKKNVLKYMDELTSEAEIIGSINTIKINDGKLIGHNTDAIGFQTSLQRLGYSVGNKNAILFGAGGAARAVIVALIREGCKKIVIANRNIKKAQRLVAYFLTRYPAIEIESFTLYNAELIQQIRGAQLLVNATTVGMGDLDHQYILPDPNWLHKDLLVYDLIYRPYFTTLIKQAEARNIHWTNGLDMLIFQGFESLKFWVDRDFVLKKKLYLEIKNRLRREIWQESHGGPPVNLMERD